LGQTPFAGPAGLTLANDLAARGIAFRIVDPLPEPVRESRAHGFGGETLLALDSLGLVEPMLAAAKQPLPVLREYFGDKLVAQIDFAAVPARSLPKDGACLSTAGGAGPGAGAGGTRPSRRVVDWFDGDRDGSRCDRPSPSRREPWRDPRRLDRGLRRQSQHRPWTVSPDFPGKSLSGIQGLFCECDLDWKRSRDIWWTWQNKRGLVGAIYNDFTEKWHVLAIDFEQDDWAAGAEFARIGELLRLMSGDDAHLSDPAWVHSSGSFSQRIAEPFIMGRAALAGDAAHVFSSWPAKSCILRSKTR
jgi:2-polyprenyl-6-methoxyphenol hydroxylase-like FAD-dependent oxidoreductase